MLLIPCRKGRAGPKAQSGLTIGEVCGWGGVTLTYDKNCTVKVETIGKLRDIYEFLQSAASLRAVLLHRRLLGDMPFSRLSDLRARAGIVPIGAIVEPEDANGHWVRNALGAGALAVLPDNMNTRHFYSIGLLLLAGIPFVPPEIALAEAPRAPAPFTPRQHEIAGLLALGLSNKEIARRLNLSEPTVKTHISTMLRNTGTANRLQLALYAR